jgi:acyl-CoA synthetase (AMP-forming)/AMP-acid ligase II
MTGQATSNIASGLTAMARERPGALAVLAPSGRDRAGRARHVHWTFAQLDRLSDFAASGLRAKGIRPGTRTVLMVKPGLSFFALTFGLFKAGAVPVLVDPGLGIKNLGPCLAEAEPEAFVGIPLAQAARKVLGWAKKSIRISTTIHPVWPEFWLDIYDQDSIAEDNSPPIARVSADETAAILFTSGSTGVPKGAVYTHSIFQAQIELLKRTYEIQPGEVDLCTFPLFALFGPILGMTCVVPEMDSTRPGKVDPSKIIEAIEDFGVTNLFGSPALIRRVGDYGEANGLKLPTLRRVISAGAPVPARVLETFSKLLNEGVQIFTPYGATESLPVASIGSDEILGETRHSTDNGCGVCVGRAVEGMRVEIIKIQDEPIPTWSDDLIVQDGEVGEIVVQGPVVTRSYFQRNEANALAKIDDPTNGGIWGVSTKRVGSGFSAASRIGCKPRWVQCLRSRWRAFSIPIRRSPGRPWWAWGLLTKRSQSSASKRSQGWLGPIGRSWSPSCRLWPKRTQSRAGSTGFCSTHRSRSTFATTRRFFERS